MAKPAVIPRVPALSALLIVASSFLACGSPPPNPAKGSADITVHALTAKAPTAVKLTVQCPGVLPTPLRIPLTEKGGQFSAIVNNLPIADDYLFTAEAFDIVGNLLSHGVAAGVIIGKGKTAKVIIYLNDLVQPPPFTNSGPLFDSITLSASSVLPGGNVSLSATAHDPDVGQTATLVFTWVPAAGCGAIAGANTVPGTGPEHPSGSRATWVAPQVLGDCQVTLTVKDSLGLGNSANFTVTVASDVNGTGSASVVAVFNGAPSILGITADPAQISSDSATSGVLAVEATDPEDDPLTYAWTSPADSPCTIDFGTPNEAATTFAISAKTTDATSCTFLVAVSDGVWPDTTFVRNTSTASLTLAITHVLVVRLPPVFGIAYQSEDIAMGGAQVMFGAIAADPSGGTLTFDWSASAGSTPAAADPKALELDPAFVTSSTWTVPTDAENAMTNLVVAVTATSSVTTLQSSFTFSLVPANRH